MAGAGPRPAAIVMLDELRVGLISSSGDLSEQWLPAAIVRLDELRVWLIGSSGDLSEPLHTLVLQSFASNTSELVPPATETAKTGAVVATGGAGGLRSPFIAPDCWFFSSFKICSLASSWEDVERPRFCTSRRGGTRGRSRDGGEIRADWGNGCLMFLNIFENVKNVSFI